jgi:UDP-glucose:(heptosyl)LPS alpha-1,3-glucosyltransferase
LVILHADPARGGAERYTIDLAASLRSRGHDVTLVASSFSETLVSEKKILLPVGRGTRLRKYVRFLDALDQHLQAERYDIVHAMLPVRQCDIYHPHAGIAAEAVARGHLKHRGRTAQAAAMLANRVNLKRRKFAAVERELLTGAKPPIVLCLSEYVKRDVTAHYTIAPDRLATLFNAVDLTRFDPSARPEARTELRKELRIAPDKIVALMIAQDFARKGLREAILALAQLNDPRLTLVVVGKEDPASYAALAKQEAIAERVIFAGKTDDPYSFYRAADFFLLPTRHDPCSLVVLEALAMGLPVISTVFNGACEIMTSGRHGFVLPDPSDVGAIVRSMQKLLDSQARRAMSDACLALRPKLAYEHHLDRLLSIYMSAKS